MEQIINEVLLQKYAKERGVKSLTIIPKSWHEIGGKIYQVESFRTLDELLIKGADVYIIEGSTTRGFIIN